MLWGAINSSFGCPIIIANVADSVKPLAGAAMLFLPPLNGTGILRGRPIGIGFGVVLLISHTAPLAQPGVSGNLTESPIETPLIDPWNDVTVTSFAGMALFELVSSTS